jgi:rhodanese-related sulfurtransferase
VTDLALASPSLPRARRSVAEALAEARRDLRRVGPAEAAALVVEGALLIDIRPVENRLAEGEIPGAWIVDRNVLQWRLDPQSPDRLPSVDDSFYDRILIIVCNEGYASSFAARSLQYLGLAAATDLDGGYRGWAAAGFPTSACADRR